MYKFLIFIILILYTTTVNSQVCAIFVQSCQSGSGGALSHTCTLNGVGANHFIAMTFRENVTAPTETTSTLTWSHAVNDGVNGYIWYAQTGAVSGTIIFTVNSSTGQFFEMDAAELANIDPTSPLDQTAVSGLQNWNPPSYNPGCTFGFWCYDATVGPITTTSANEIMIEHGTSYGNDSTHPTVGSGWTEYAAGSVTGTLYKNTTTIGSYLGQALFVTNGGADNYTLDVASFKSDPVTCGSSVPRKKGWVF